MSKQPECLWAQCSDKVYLTVSLPDARGISVDCEPEGVFKFSAIDVNNESYNFILQLYGNISPQGCETKIGSGNIMCRIPKEQKGRWKRLLKFKVKVAPHNKIKIDWNKWCDEEGENLESKNLASADVIEDVEIDNDTKMLWTSLIRKNIYKDFGE